MATMDITTHDVFLKEVASKKAIMARHDALVMGKLIMRWDVEVQKYGDSIAVPRFSTLSAYAVGDDGSVTPQAPTETEATVSINRHYASTFQISDRVLAQSHHKDMIDKYSMEAGKALGEEFEVALFGLYSGLDQSTTAIADLDEDTILDAVRQLDNAKAPAADRSGVGRPSQKISILKISRFTEELARLGSGRQITSGQVTMQTHGVKWYFSNLVVSASSQAKNMIFQREAFVAAVQKKIKVEELARTGLRRTFAASHLYGIGETRDDHAVVCATTSNSGT